MCTKYGVVDFIYYFFYNFDNYDFLQTDDGEDDLKKGTQLLEIYALEIQMYTAQKNNKKLKVSVYLFFIF